MKKLSYITIVIFLISFGLFAQTDYYYSNGEQVHLTINKQYVNIVTDNAFDETQLSAIGIQPFTIRTENTMRNGEYKKIAKLEFTATITNQAVYDQKITELKNLTNVEGVYPYYTIDGNSFGVSNYFKVKLNQPSDITNLQVIATQKNVDIDHQITSLPLWYVLSANEETLENTLNICVFFHETGLFNQVEPNFTGSVAPETGPVIETSSTNSSFTLEDCDGYEEDVESEQWNLFNNTNGNPLADINVCEAWNVTKGDKSTIAIIDTGIYAGIDELPTLANSVIQSSPTGGTFYDYYYNFGGQGTHGTSVAGVIAALHDSDNGGGIAPDASILYIANELAQPLNYDEIAIQILNVANNYPGVGVVNMSFGWGASPTSGMLKDAIDYALINGHQHQGLVMIAGAGNNPGTSILQPANHPGVMAITGSSTTGEHNQANTYGAGLDLAAPSDNIPTSAYSSSGGTTWLNFNGTSAAAPHVSGIAALMFSAYDPTDDDHIPIKAEAIRNILRRTAQKSGIHDYNETLGFIFGLGSWNKYMGYGIPDATACVKTAEAFTTDSGVLDLHMRNSVNDYGFQPDFVTKHSNYVLWNSPDIWVRNTGDYSFDHENPIKETTVSVFVRVINKSNKTRGADVKLYWSKLGGGPNNWPSHWDGSTTMQNNNGDSIVIGNIIGEESVAPIAPGEQAIVTFQWDVPNPVDFAGIFGNSENNDFGFVARIVTSHDPMISNETPYTGPNGDSGNIWYNTRNNNNIVWKNVEVVNAAPNPKPGSITLANNSNTTKEYSLEFIIDDNPVGNAIFEEAEVTIHMDNDLHQDWVASGAITTNFETTNQVFKVTEDDAIIDNISLEAGEIRTLQISFNFLSDELSSKKEFNYHYIQRDKATDDIVYGKSFLIKKGEPSTFDADAGNDKEIDKNQSVTLSATDINEPATYNWYDPEGNLIYTGMDFTLSPELTKQYTLEIIKDADGLKDYDAVTVEVNPFVFSVMSPNPASNEVGISYIAEDANSAYFMFTEQTTGNTYNHILDTQEDNKTIDVSSYPTGIFLVSLICDGTLIETKQLIIN